jgi:hypothetical protein
MDLTGLEGPLLIVDHDLSIELPPSLKNLRQFS